MKKKELLAMPKLPATPKMMRLAVEDIPQKQEVERWYGYKEVREVRKYDLFMRCIVKNDILKLSLFSPFAMRLGGRRPIYDIYLDKPHGTFLTYDYEGVRWLTGKVNTLSWKQEQNVKGTHWISPADDKLLRQYLKTDQSNLRAVLSFQENIREEELKQRHKRETDKWDNDLAQTPELPKDWNHWVDKVAMQEHFIFYDYVRGGATHGHCSYCEKDVPIHRPTHNKTGRCPCCRHKVTYKSRGKAGWLKTSDYYAYLLQACECGFVCREFRVYHSYAKGKYDKPSSHCHEIRRSLFESNGKQLRAYYWGVYKQQYSHWISGNNCAPSYYGYCGTQEGRVYGKTLPRLAKYGLGRTGLIEYIRQRKTVDPEHYLAVLNVAPQLEQLAKASLPTLVGECLHSYYGFTEKLNKKETSLTGMLGINTQELKRLRENAGGTLFLAWIRYEKAIGKQIPDRVISWFCREKIEWEDISFIADRMSTLQIYNYIRRNMKQYGMKSREVLTTWADYLSMATRFQYDTSDAIVYRTGKLRQRHDELAARGIEKEIVLAAGEILQKYPHLDEIMKSLDSKYAFADGDYIISAPSKVEDIIKEGRTLHHCLAHADRYWDRIEKHESYLLFLRKVSAPEESYYTMEIEPGGTVRQIRTYYDRQNDDIDAARIFLKKWQVEITKRLTADDHEKAKASKVLRLQEFMQLQNDQVKIHTGHLAGHLLVEVLTADLMENMAA